MKKPYGCRTNRRSTIDIVAWLTLSHLHRLDVLSDKSCDARKVCGVIGKLHHLLLARVLAGIGVVRIENMLAVDSDVGTVVIHSLAENH